MKYEIIKGSEKDFEGAPEQSVQVWHGPDCNFYVWDNGDWQNQSIKGCITARMAGFQSYPGHCLIAERRPITAPELKPIYGDGVHDDTDALNQRLDMGIDFNDITGEKGRSFKVSNQLKFNPVTDRAWDGKGLPPVGTKCECDLAGNWQECTVILSVDNAIAWQWHSQKPNNACISYAHCAPNFRPIRSPEDAARSNAIGEMERAYEELTGKPAREAEEYYNFIAAGKITGINIVK